MALAITQVGAFNSYRYLIGKVDLVAGQSQGRVEDAVRARVALGDTAFARRKYDVALQHYLAAYSSAHAYLHPAFPVATLATKPHILLELNALDALVEAVAFNARYRHVDGLPPTVAPFAPPTAVTKLVDEFREGGAPAISNAEVQFRSAMNLLAVGEFGPAEEAFAGAKRSNRGTSRSETLLGHITVGEAAARVGQGRLDEAVSSLKAAAKTYQETGSTFAGRIVSDNLAVLTERTEPSGRVPRRGPTEHLLGPAGVINRPTDVVGRITGTIGSSPISSLPTNAVIGRVEIPIRPPTAPAPVAPEDDLQVPLEAGALAGVDLAAAEKVRAATTFGVATARGNVDIDLTKGGTDIVAKLLAPRTGVTDVIALRPQLDIAATFLAYLPHVYGFVLPMDIGDCYSKLGHRTKAVDYYMKALDYPHLNVAIEGTSVWLKAAQAIVAEADHLFRAQRDEEARPLYEMVVDSSGSVPSGSRLYSHGAFTSLRSLAEDAVAAIGARQVFTANPMLASIVAHARAQLTKLDAGLNWIGLAPDVVPIWTFDFLQSTARYFAQNVIQAWRQYVSFRSSAEAEEMTERELAQAIVLNESAEETQAARRELAEAQLDVSRKLRDGAALHRQHLIEQRDQYDEVGWVLAELDRFVTWWGNANLGGDYEANHWDWGGGHSLDIGSGSGQERIDAALRYRNRLSHGMQIDNFDRQIAEAQNQIDVADRQIEVARAQVEVAELELAAARQRTEFARQNLAFFEDQEFTPDLWHALADALAVVADDYLRMGIYAAFLMERAYNVEHDRDLHRIRFDYAAPGGASELTAGDSLMLDIDSFTHDVLMHVNGRPNPVRHVISLADFAPQAFMDFRRTGVLEFTIPIDEIERAYPGTYLHRIQGVEVEIEGLQVPEGIHGTLEHLGISTWRRADGTLRSRVSAPESMVLSAMNLRRDLALFRVDPDRLKVFENSGTAASWRIHLPPGTNDVDFATVFDVRLVVYFVSMHSPELEATIRAGFPTEGGAAQAFSARLHAPDEYFVFGSAPDRSDAITFTLDPRSFPFNQRGLEVTELGVVVLREGEPMAPFDGVDVSVSIGGDSATGTTDAAGLVESDAGAGALGGLVGHAVEDVVVTFTGPDEQRDQVGDVQLFLNYRFDYR